MKHSMITAAIAGALVWAPSAVPLAAQTASSHAAKAEAAGAVPRMPDGHPDLSGVWWRGSDVGGRGFAASLRQPAGEKPVSFTDLYQPWAVAKAKTLADKDDPTRRCVPTAFGTLNVRLFDVGAVGQIIQTPKFVVMLQETYHGWQLIPFDGRAHRDNVPPSYRGDAVGHWDGDTFVVDITNFDDSTWMWAEGRVSFHSDALHVIERYRRVDEKTLTVDATVEDPKVLTKPWVVPTQTLTLAPFDQIMQLACVDTDAQALRDAATAQNSAKR